jgi:hypothetical protein
MHRRSSNTARLSYLPRWHFRNLLQVLNTSTVRKLWARAESCNMSFVETDGSCWSVNGNTSTEILRYDDDMKI